VVSSGVSGVVSSGGSGVVSFGVSEGVSVGDSDDVCSVVVLAFGVVLSGCLPI